MDTAFTTSVDKIVAELEKLSASVDKLSVPDRHKDFKPVAVHAATKSFKCLVGVGGCAIIYWLADAP